MDLHRHALLRGNDRLPLTPAQFIALAYLTRHAGRVVSQEQLHEAAWGPEHSVSVVDEAILQIRHALGDDDKDSRFIRSVPGLGYCFVADVEDGEQVHSESAKAFHDSDTEALLAGESSSGMLSRRFSVALILMILAAFFAVIAFQKAPPEVSASNPHRLTRSPSHIVSPLLTDGAHIFYMRYGDGQYSIEEVPVDGGQSRPVDTGIANPELCDLDKQSGSLLLRSLIHSRDELNPIYIKPKEGPPRQLGYILAYDAAWYPDGKHILYSIHGNVYETNLKGSPGKKLFSVPGNAYWFRWSPDGQRLRFTVISDKTEQTSIWEAREDGPEPLQLFPKIKHNLCCGTWTPRGSFFLFQARVNHRYQIWADRDQRNPLQLHRNEPFPLVSGAAGYRGPITSSDGKKLFVRSEAPKGELVQYDPGLGKFLSILPSLSVRTAAYSPDRHWIAYTSLGGNNLWRCRADGTDCLQLTRNFRQVVMPRWSPDGRTIAFMGHRASEPWQVYTVPSGGGAMRAITHGAKSKGYPDWFMDGRTLVYSDVPPTSQARGIYLLNLQTGKVTTVPQSSGFSLPRVSPDGRHIVALHSDDEFLYLFDMTSGKWRLMADVPASYPNWSHNSRYVYYRPLLKDNRAIYRVNIATGAVEEYATLSGVETGPYFMGDWIGLAPDGSPIAVRNGTIEGLYSWDLSTH